MVEPSEMLDVALQAAGRGAEQLLHWKGKFDVREKSPRDLVTDADVASEQAIRQVIAAAYPDHGILAEESAAAGELHKSYCWIIDPLDGTTNYAHGLPCYGVSIAVACDNRLLAGVVLDPERGECFAASTGGGATLNGKPLSVSSITELQHALLAVSLPPALRDESPDLQSFLRAAPKCQAVRRTGSAALNLAYVACGRMDGHWAHEIHAWDGAAGVLLINEAGGTTTNCNGGPYCLARADYLAAATPELHAELLALIRS